MIQMLGTVLVPHHSMCKELWEDSRDAFACPTAKQRKDRLQLLNKVAHEKRELLRVATSSRRNMASFGLKCLRLCREESEQIFEINALAFKATTSVRVIFDHRRFVSLS